MKPITLAWCARPTSARALWRGLWRLALLGALAWLSGCAGPSAIDRSISATGQDSRVRFLVLHITMIDTPRSLKVLSTGAVSAHYLVTDTDRFKVYNLVDESQRAYHAGFSSWKGQTFLNASSIGIEIVSLGYRDDAAGRTWIPFPEGQIDRLIPLVKDIVQRHGITPDRVLAHSDIAPQRRQDPGPLFPWKRLAQEGLVLWPDEADVARRQPGFEAQMPSVAWFQKKLAAHGFDVPQTGQLDETTRNVLIVFQMKYRPARYDGAPDAQTAALLDVLTAPAKAR